MMDDLPMLDEFEVRRLARDGWKRQLVADARLEMKLAKQRLAHAPLVPTVDAPAVSGQLPLL